MVRKTTTRSVWLRVSALVCVALLNVPTMRGQHAFEYAARIGANALLYDTDYGKIMPNYNVGMDFSWKLEYLWNILIVILTNSIGALLVRCIVHLAAILAPKKE